MSYDNKQVNYGKSKVIICKKCKNIIDKNEEHCIYCGAYIVDISNIEEQHYSKDNIKEESVDRFNSFENKNNSNSNNVRSTNTNAQNTSKNLFIGAFIILALVIVFLLGKQSNNLSIRSANNTNSSNEIKNTKSNDEINNDIIFNETQNVQADNKLHNIDKNEKTNLNLLDEGTIKESMIEFYDCFSNAVISSNHYDSNSFANLFYEKGVNTTHFKGIDDYILWCRRRHANGEYSGFEYDFNILSLKSLGENKYLVDYTVVMKTKYPDSTNKKVRIEGRKYSKVEIKMYEDTASQYRFKFMHMGDGGIFYYDNEGV